MCGGFNCTKNALTALNVLYIAVSFILIGVAAYGRVASIVSNIAIIGGIIACGAFLFFLALLGFVGARKHHQVLLFFYMIILFILFVVQFSIACACLAVSDVQQHDLAQKGWYDANSDLRMEAQHIFACCGFSANRTQQELSTCAKSVNCCATKLDCQCPPCGPKIQQAIFSALNISGGIGIFFSLTEFLGVWLTIRYRNQKDPRADPSAFL